MKLWPAIAAHAKASRWDEPAQGIYNFQQMREDELC